MVKAGLDVSKFTVISGAQKILVGYKVSCLQLQSSRLFCLPVFRSHSLFLARKSAVSMSTTSHRHTRCKMPLLLVEKICCHTLRAGLELAMLTTSYCKKNSGYVLPPQSATPPACVSHLRKRRYVLHPLLAWQIIAWLAQAHLTEYMHGNEFPRHVAELLLADPGRFSNMYLHFLGLK